MTRGQRVFPHVIALVVVLATVCQPQRIWAQAAPKPLLCPGGALKIPEPKWLEGVVDPKTPGVTQPTLLRSAKPRYTREAMEAGVTGEVWLDAVVGVDGKVRNMCLVKSIPMLDAQAVEAAREFEFRPARKDGEAVPILVRLQIAFNLREKTQE